MTHHAEYAKRRSDLTELLRSMVKEGGTVHADEIQRLTGVPEGTLRTLLVRMNEGVSKEKRIRLGNDHMVHVPQKAIIDPIQPARGLSFGRVKNVRGLGASMALGNVIKT